MLILILTKLLSIISDAHTANSGEAARDTLLQSICEELRADWCAVYQREGLSLVLGDNHLKSAHIILRDRIDNMAIPETPVLVREPRDMPVSQNFKACLVLPLCQNGAEKGVFAAGWEAASPPFDCLDDGVAVYMKPIAQLLCAIYCAEPAMEKLQKQADTLSALFENAERELEENRKKVSLELHDEVGQVLTSILLQLKMLYESDDFEYVKGRIGGLHHITSLTLEEVRRISRNLRPFVLEKLGLQAAVTAHVQEYTKSTCIEVNTRFVGLDAKLKGDVQTVLYRAVQEGLTNVARHAGATSVELTITLKGERVLLQITDNGKGMDKDAPPGIGLMGMRERARLLGGRFWCFNREAGGFSINVLLPHMNGGGG